MSSVDLYGTPNLIIMLTMDNEYCIGIIINFTELIVGTHICKGQCDVTQ